MFPARKQHCVSRFSPSPSPNNTPLPAAPLGSPPRSLARRRRQAAVGRRQQLHSAAAKSSQGQPAPFSYRLCLSPLLSGLSPSTPNFGPPPRGVCRAQRIIAVSHVFFSLLSPLVSLSILVLPFSVDSRQASKTSAAAEWEWEQQAGVGHERWAGFRRGLVVWQSAAPRAQRRQVRHRAKLSTFIHAQPTASIKIIRIF